MLTEPENVPADNEVIEYRFCGYSVDVQRRKLLGPDAIQITISSRAFDTLLVLIRHHGEILPKSLIMETVWPNVVVEENNLNQAIFSLRKALNDPKKESRFIMTLPGKGYSFVAPIDRVASNVDEPEAGFPETAASRSNPLSQGRGWSIRQPWIVSMGLLIVIATGFFLSDSDPDPALMMQNPPSTPSDMTSLGSNAVPPVVKNSIAVLPFESLDKESENPLFTLALHDEIINQLSKVSSLKVIARDSVLSLVDQQLSMNELAKVLRVESFLSGTIIYIGDTARISLHMHDANSGVMLWSETYQTQKQDFMEMFSLQSDIARNVVSVLEAEILLAEKEYIEKIPTDSFEAYQDNLAAKNAHYQQDFPTEWELARQAIILDPDYQDAHATFSSVNTLLVAIPLPGMSSREHYALALQSAEKIIQLSPDTSLGYALKANALSTAQDWQEISRMMDKLEEIQAPPADLLYTALIMMNFGDFETAIEVYRASLITEPLNLYARGFLMAALEITGRREEAEIEYKLGEKLSPAWWGDVINIFLALGRHEPLQDINELMLVPDDLKDLLHHINDEARVRTALDDYRAVENKIPAQAIYYAAIAAIYGDHELATLFLRAALHNNWSALFWAWLPIFDETRKHENFNTLLYDSGVIDYWQNNGWPVICQPSADSFSCDRSPYSL